MSERQRYIKQGVLTVLPLFVPVIPFALAFGIAVDVAGIAPLLGWSSTPLMFGGAAQITLLTLLGEGASMAAAVTAALIVGARHLLYSVTMAPYFRHQPQWFRWVGPYVLIDQVFMLASTFEARHDPDAFRWFYLSAGFMFWFLWMLFTGIGLFIGPIVPDAWQLSFAIPILFIGLLAAGINSWRQIAVAVVAAGVTVALASLPNRSGLLIGATLGIALGFLFERFRR